MTAPAIPDPKATAEAIVYASSHVGVPLILLGAAWSLAWKWMDAQSKRPRCDCKKKARDGD